jgi:8-oxo-dGTP pyrophosphatase MutT (NUDIX family)
VADLDEQGARGGRQLIPRPPDFVAGAPSPWAALTPAERTFTVADVRARLAASPPPQRVVVDPTGMPVGLREAAVLIPVFEEDGEARLVLTRRPEHLPTHQGQIAFPGGKIDLALDVDAVAAALREADEEIGLSPSLVEVVAELDHLPSFGGPFVIAPFVGIVDGRPQLVAAPGEVDRVFDVAISELLDSRTHSVERWEHLDEARVMHFFLLADETVWGATARILADFLGRLTGVGLAQ